MTETLISRTTKHSTRPQDVNLPLGFLKSAIEREILEEIPRSTWSDWCRRCIDRGDATVDREVDIPTAAALFTIGGLYAYGARSYSGRVYKRLYPQCLKRIQEICNV